MAGQKAFTGFRSAGKLCQLSWQEDKPVIPPENDFWQASPGEKEVILNLLGQGYKYFGMAQQAAQCYHLASEVAIYFRFRQRITVITFLLFIIFLCHNGSMLRLTRSIIFFIPC